ncbi:MAG TPA: cupredoxin family copper-binding protein [Solirubrobacteraceae bacterium]|jgi:plastocyanin|nr:cupredoxin family copper-binding protein [Solirubrobacteraceae bacterium]
MKKDSGRRGRRCAAAAIVASCGTALALGPAVGSAAAADPDCGVMAMAQPFIDHIDSAHLERSPFGQVRDLMNVDAYTLTHTVLVEDMLAPLVPTLMGTITPLVDHVDTAHLERSPEQQVKDLLDVNDYVLAHTVLVESMLAPAVSGTGCIGGDDSAAPAMPAMPGMAAPAPAATAAPAPAPTAGGMSAAVKMSGLAFSPAALTVPVGATVTWTNMDDAPHTVTSKGNGGLRSKTLQKGGTYSYMFMAKGTFTYYCTVHPNMVATVTVQ